VQDVVKSNVNIRQHTYPEYRLLPLPPPRKRY
jgi:hypothetical protein